MNVTCDGCGTTRRFDDGEEHPSKWYWTEYQPGTVKVYGLGNELSMAEDIGETVQLHACSARCLRAALLGLDVRIAEMTLKLAGALQGYALGLD